MHLPAIHGIIARRILANYRIDPDALARHLPEPFRPAQVNGHAIGGVCLIRLEALRPKHLPSPFGLHSENAAHRIAVEWDHQGETRHGVYVLRRDTDSRLQSLAGGRIFPGISHHAVFQTRETPERLYVSLRSSDGETRVTVEGTVTDALPETSIFPALSAASGFFEKGSLGYSPAREKGHYDGMELQCRNWHVEPLDIQHAESSFFDDRKAFPPGTVRFDCALLMRGIQHEWHDRGQLCCSTA